MNFKIIGLVTGLVLTATLASCSGNAPTNTQSAPGSPAANSAPDDAMKGEGNAMKGEGNAMKDEGNAMKGEGNAMKGEGNAMKGDTMSPSPTTNP